LVAARDKIKINLSAWYLDRSEKKSVCVASNIVGER